MNDTFLISSINIELDASVKSLTKVAAMCLSGYIANGIVLAKNPNPNIRIYKDRIEFGQCYNPHITAFGQGLLPNYEVESKNLKYVYTDSFEFSSYDGKLDYVGFFAPTEPDNEAIFNMIYPRFA